MDSVEGVKVEEGEGLYYFRNCHFDVNGELIHTLVKHGRDKWTHKCISKSSRGLALPLPFALYP